MAVTANAFADALAVTPFPSDKTRDVLDLVESEMRDIATLPTRAILNSAFWTDKGLSESGAVSLFRFVGEFKRTIAAKNFNQLLMDFATGQCQLLALGIRETIWGATCSLGVVELFSSQWNTDGSVSNLSSFVLGLQENNSQQCVRVYSHTKWHLTDPVDFLTFYSFLCNIGEATSTFNTCLLNLTPETILASLKAHPWRVPTPPPSRSNSTTSSKSSRKRGRGTESKSRGRKDSSIGEDDGRGEGGKHSRHDGEERGEEDAESSEEDGAQSAGGIADPTDMHYDNMDSDASSVSTRFRDEWRMEEAPAKEMSGEGAPLKESLLQALTAQSRVANVLGDDYFRIIENWRSSVSV